MKGKPQARPGHQAKGKAAPKAKVPHARLLIGGGVLIALVAIVVIKLASQASASGRYRVASAPATAQAVQSVGLGPQPAPAQAATALTSASLEADPFPARPAAQIGWAQRNQKPAMVLFHSKTCIPCKQMEALVAQVRADYEPDVVFIDVLTDDRSNLDMIRQAGIQAIPTTFFITHEGKGKRAVGALKEEALRAELDALRAGG